MRVLESLSARALVEPPPNRGTPAGQLLAGSLPLPIGSASALLRHICRTGYTPKGHDTIGIVKMTTEQWEASITELWRRFDSLDREDGVGAMREMAEACPVTEVKSQVVV